jgi:hypothetical protein
MVSKEFEATLGKRYYSYTSNPLKVVNLKNPRENTTRSRIQYISPCTREGCNNVETHNVRFQRCSVCYTKYCSRECQVYDHKYGKHKEKCRLFSIAKDVVKNTLCESCWNDKWDEVSNPKSQINFFPCNNCMMTPMNCTDNVLDSLHDDSDIYRVWLS